MARYRYEGPGPVEDEDGHLVRPGDVAEFDADPAWGPWQLLDDAALSAPQTPPAGAGTQDPAPDAGSGAPASTPPGDGTEGN